jgi:hypothetical protein
MQRCESVKLKQSNRGKDSLIMAGVSEVSKGTQTGKVSGVGLNNDPKIIRN